MSEEPLPVLKGRWHKLLPDWREQKQEAVKTLLLAALVGVLVGFVGVSFELASNWMAERRAHLPGQWFSHPLAVITSSFIFSGVLAGAAYFLVKRFAPEAGGSGIPEIEASLQELRPVRWWRVIPVKFFGGIGGLGAGMVLGREGPTVQIGANLGQMVAQASRVRDSETRHILLASGSAAGIATAFNAPLAGIVFVIEEMRSEFRYGLISVKAVFLGAIFATIACRIVTGARPLLQMAEFGMPAQSSLWLYFVLGGLFGVVGVGFNRFLLFLQGRFNDFYQDKIWRFVGTGALIGGCCGVIALALPEFVGGGFNVIGPMAQASFGFGFLVLIFVMRFFLSVLCFSSGAPGGIFSPLLALGASFGAIFGYGASMLLPDSELQMGTFMVAGMGALFAACVRAPLTGIILVLEMTSSYNLILPVLITCLGAVMVAQLLGGRPLYTQLMENILRRNGISYKA